MKFSALSKFLLICLLAISNQALLEKYEETSLQIKDPPAVQPKDKTKVFSIKNITKLLKKFENFANTNFGSFTIGFLFEYTKDYVEEKAQPVCTDNPWWQMLECMVSGADVALEQHFALLGVSDPANSVTETAADITSIHDNSENTVKGSNCPEENWYDYISRNSKKIVDTAYSIALISEKVKNSVTAWTTSVGQFFNRPCVLGAIKVGKCVALIPAVRSKIKSVTFDAVISLFQLQWLAPFKNIIFNFKEVLCIINEGFKNLRAILNKGTYASTQLKWYDYGKATAEVMYRIQQIYAMKKTKRLLK